MNPLTLRAINPYEIYSMDGDTPLLYRFKTKATYMQGDARTVKAHKFAEAMAECYVVPRYSGVLE